MKQLKRFSKKEKKSKAKAKTDKQKKNAHTHTPGKQTPRRQATAITSVEERWWSPILTFDPPRRVRRGCAPLP